MEKAESFIEFLDAYGQAHGASVGYDGKGDFGDWQSAFREVVTSLRGPVPDRVVPDVEVLEEWVEADHTRQMIRVRVSEFSSLIAYLLIPKGIEAGEKRAALIASHGHTKHGIDTTCGVVGMEDAENAKRAYGLSAVRSGYVVIAPAWWGWHGRDGHLDQVGGRDRCNVIQMAAAMYGMNVTDLHIQDGQAAVDVLVNQPKVDPDRIGCLGNSYGGRNDVVDDFRRAYSSLCGDRLYEHLSRTIAQAFVVWDSVLARDFEVWRRGGFVLFDCTEGATIAGGREGCVDDAEGSGRYPRDSKVSVCTGGCGGSV